MDAVDDSSELPGVTEPWHVPAVPADVPPDDVPPEIVVAAKRALRARRPGVAVLDLVVEQPVAACDGARQFQFSDGSLVVELLSQPEDSAVRLRIRCPARAGGRVEILHGGPTTEVALDGDGVVDVPALPGLLSLVLHPGNSSLAPVQTTWVRLP